MFGFPCPVRGVKGRPSGAWLSKAKACRGSRRAAAQERRLNPATNHRNVARVGAAQTQARPNPAPPSSGCPFATCSRPAWCRSRPWTTPTPCPRGPACGRGRTGQVVQLVWFRLVRFGLVWFGCLFGVRQTATQPYPRHCARPSTAGDLQSEVRTCSVACSLSSAPQSPVRRYTSHIASIDSHCTHHSFSVDAPGGYEGF